MVKYWKAKKTFSTALEGYVWTFESGRSFFATLNI